MKVSFRQFLGNFALVSTFTSAAENSLLDIGGIVMYLTLIGVFLFLTVQSYRKEDSVRRGRHEEITEKFRSVQTRHGFYSVGMIAVVIVIAVVVNLIVGQLPEKWKQVDVSNKNIYGVSKTSRKL